ncbi:hypothetical protein GWI33_019816 [Rhynchophorus ferrugineus]|uniref:DNA helicase Pif1-like 2B domain-containing protein n=1 Tax=Rhynchophorus ferrugineus TaxID=354439 RepID=A0A834HVG2_RHYFE|nr:hypothetical protein GWI33_019816 [Rhynchophorus ferrugineus]
MYQQHKNRFFVEVPPPHNLQLKVGSVVIMLGNINQPRLCNGTTLAVKMMNNGIQATIIKGKYRRGCLDPAYTDDSNGFTIRL